MIDADSDAMRAGAPVVGGNPGAVVTFRPVVAVTAGEAGAQWSFGALFGPP